MSDGETDAEALSNAHDALKAWIADAKAAGRVIPHPEPRRLYA
jgi:predicted RNase H-like HicB family nuclease